jgi:hypothetical protein
MTMIDEDKGECGSTTHYTVALAESNPNALYMPVVWKIRRKVILST